MTKNRKEVVFDLPRILDGGFATELISAGFPVDGDPLWSTRVVIENPRAVIDAHKRFLHSGASIIETCTYQAGLQLLQSELKSSKGDCINILKSAVQLAQEAKKEFIQETATQASNQSQILIAGSIGPYGTLLCDGSEYTGNYMDSVSLESIIQYYIEQAGTLIDAGVDILAFDTVPALSEAQCIIQALGKLPRTWTWISFSCKSKEHTCCGDNFSDVAKEIESSNFVDAIGINCTMPDLVTPLLKSVKNCSKPFVIYPNSGEMWQPNKEWDKNPNCSGLPLTGYIPEWISLGVKIFGGCCRIGPKEIHEIYEAVKNASS